jgi:thiamine-phosphate pyrophosphorylase
MSDDSPSLYLITPRLTEALSFAPALEAALDAGVVACVLVLLEARDEGEARKIIRTLAPIAQDRGAALLVEDNVQLAQRAGGDGVHIRTQGDENEPELKEAIRKLKPDGIVGAGGLKTRHDAMSAGELEVDYVMFGEPARDGYTPPFSGTLERVAWWAEIFNIPAVGYAGKLDQVAELAQAGADFVALGDAVWDDPRGPASAVRDAMAAIAKSRVDVP